MKIHITNLLIYSVVIVLCSMLSSCGTLSQPETENKISHNSSDDIVELYQEIIDMRQYDVEEIKEQIEYGYSTQSDLTDAEAKVTEARIELAEFLGQNDTAIEELQSLIQIYTEKRDSIIKEVSEKKRPQLALYDIDYKLLYLKIRLARIKLEKD